MSTVQRNLQRVIEGLDVHPGEERAWKAIREFVKSGDLAKLKRSPEPTTYVVLDGLWTDLVPSPDLDEDTSRLLQALIATNCTEWVAHWFLSHVASESDAADTHALLRERLRGTSTTPTQLLEWTMRWAPLIRADGVLTSAGRWFLTQTTSQIVAAISTASLGCCLPDRRGMIGLLEAKAPRLLRDVVPAMLLRGYAAAVEALIEYDAVGYESYITAFLSASDDPELLDVGFRRLHAKFGERYLKNASDAVVAGLLDPNGNDEWETAATGWLIEHDPHRAVEVFSESDFDYFYAPQIAEKAVARLGAGARPLLVAWAKHRDARTALAVTKQLIALDERPDEKLLREAIRRGLSARDGEAVVSFVELVATSPKLEFCIDMLWDALASPSLPVRRTASRGLALRGAESAPRALELLKSTAAGTRLAAAGVLIGIGSPETLAAVDNHLDAERNAAAVDEMLTALVAHRSRHGGTFSRSDVARAIARDRARLAKPPRAWVDRGALPPLVDVHGAPLSAQEIAYLIFRQSCCKEMTQDVVARPIYEQIDRKKSGDFAFALLQQFLRSPQEAKDRWALVVACRLGDDRVVPFLTRLIHDWAECGRGKLAEWAVEALTIQGGDLALLAVDAITIKYRSKNVNVGRAASAALDRAADELGVSRDELGDRIVPWLVFEPGVPKVYDADGRRLELRIGTDFKPRLVDVAKRKELGAMPKSAGAGAVAEFASLKKTLREVAKNQILRVESLFIRQRRWPAARWKELFLGHPLLLPFAVGLVWGVYRGAGPVSTFRAVGDGTLTDADDEPFALPTDGEIGIVHPLELDDGSLARWRAHVADHEIEPPFPQLARTVVRVADAERGARVYTAVSGTKLSARTFKGRATRLGWRVGSVIDAGMVWSYCVKFPAARTAAYLMLDDMNVSIDREWDITIGDLYFTKDTDRDAGYAYAGEPRDADDPSVLAFGEVDPIVFSEVLAAVAAISGKNADDAGDDAGDGARNGEADEAKGDDA